MDYFKKQNLIFFDFIDDLFELKKYKTWSELGRSITELKMKRTYRKFAELFPRKVDYAGELSKIPEGFKTIHYSTLKGTTIIDEIVRFSLYSDTILVFHPLQNPAVTNQQMSPGKNPKYWLHDFVNALYFYLVIKRWVKAGIVNLIVNPFDYSDDWYDRITKDARHRIKDEDLDNPIIKEQMMTELAEKFAVNLKPEDETSYIEEMLLAIESPRFAKSEAEMFAKVIKIAIPKTNPLFPELPRHLFQQRQLTPIKGGGPVESLLEISGLTSGNIYTPNKFNWDVLCRLGKSDFWTNMNHLYSRIDMKFLNNVSTRFALEIREEQRLAGVRKELSKLFNELNKIDAENFSESRVSLMFESFSDEVKKAETEWELIKKRANIAKTSLAVEALVAPLAISHPISIVPLILFANNTVKTIKDTRIDRGYFRLNPISVFVEVQSRPIGFFESLKNCVL